MLAYRIVLLAYRIILLAYRIILLAYRIVLLAYRIILLYYTVQLLLCQSFLNIIVLKPQVTIEALGPQTAGQPLTLACHVIVSRSIISSVDITWSRDGTILSMTIGAIGVNLLYTSYYNISLLTTNDTGKVYECDVVINSSPPVVQNETFELKVNGMIVIRHRIGSIYV